MNNGIVCKVWNIQGHTETKNAPAQLGDSIEYILNDEKVDCKLEMLGSDISDPFGQLGRECKYIQNDIKTVAGAYVGSRNLVSTDVKAAVREMMEVKEFYGKTDGRAALHGLISLSEVESGISNASLLMRMCEDVLKEVFPNNQAIFGVHTNTENLHIHFIVNSVGLDGRKIHQNDKFIKDVLQPCVNKYAQKYGFTPNEKWKNVKEAQTFTELKITIRKKIDLAIEQSTDFNSFVGVLRKEGFVVNVGKYVSLKKEGMRKAVRTHALGGNYSKDAIINRIATRRAEFGKIEVNSYVIEKKTEGVFNPSLLKMKRYRDMEPEEKGYVLKQLKLGKNPWREHRERNWQLNRIADELNRQERIVAYIEHYSPDGTLQGALDGILEAKKKIALEKQIIKLQQKKYKPIIDIYYEMKRIQRKAYLYEHENIIEYRTEFEEYRTLTRRLKAAYNKDVFEVAHFLEECDERLMFAYAQQGELSEEYKEIKRYIAQYGENLIKEGSLTQTIGVYEARKEERQRIFDADFFYISDANSEFIIRVIKTPTLDEKGNTIEKYEVAVMSQNGKVLEQFDNKCGYKDFLAKLKATENKYNMKDCKRYDTLYQAREHIGMGLNDITENELQEEKTENRIKTNELSFTQAVNHRVAGNKTFMILDAETPSYMAMVSVGENELKITIFDSSSSIQESVNVPVVAKSTPEGYKKIITLQKKYGFSDKVLTFENVNEVRNYIDTMEKPAISIDRNYIVTRG